MADARGSKDRGFTLTETIVVVLMVAMLASVIVTVVAVILRNVPPTEARADDSRSYQRLIQWLPRDAASTPPDKFDVLPGSTSCAGTTGVNLVHMSWDVGTDTAVAEYRLVPNGTGKQVQRFTCSSGAGYSDTQIIDVTSTLHNAVATPKTNGLDADVGVTLTLTTCAPADCTLGDKTIKVSAGSRNPLQTLPTTTTTSTTSTTTTSTTTTTVP